MLTKLARYLLRNDENFKKLDAELDKPEVWEINSHYTINHKDGFTLWMANGIGHFGIYTPKEIKFSFLMQKALWKKAKQIQKGTFTLTEILNRIQP